jgi:hypothetical protein
VEEETGATIGVVVVCSVVVVLVTLSGLPHPTRVIAPVAKAAPIRKRIEYFVSVIA